ncbi:MAG TPA: bifunctional DNA-formamidopyrimidine glycosylase/DNA-(apurinic or apyrimidinic site) lyase [Usitatibacter sp.]|nr:bifunctional DNA-formamidopyrimidine glycosylase/DNA-(apurinic or apyrimidinic site) lyase [Usitatibacter sp.]
MPELPEVETTRRGLVPHVVGRRIRDVVVRNARLRWPIPRDLRRRLRGEEVLAIRRRGKYLLFDCRHGHLLIHLGMSGRISLVAEGAAPRSHDHFDLQLEGGRTLRLTDPRRFGAVLWLDSPAEDHPLLRGLGLEPFEAEFTARALRERAGGRRVAVKQFLMNSRVVTGIGNIYASEALHEARVHPERSVARITPKRWELVAAAIRGTLERAIAAGGTTLRDFASAEGKPGYFQHEFAVYGREGKPCKRCGARIRASRQGQRSTFFCPRCQR